MSNSATIFTTNTPYTRDSSLVTVFFNFDGNLIMRDSQKNVKWQTNTAPTLNSNTAAYQLKMQNDGSLVILDNVNKTIWSSTSKSF